MSHRPIFAIINSNTGDDLTSTTVPVHLSESQNTGSSIICSRLGTSHQYRADSTPDHSLEYILTVDSLVVGFLPPRLTPTASFAFVTASEINVENALTASDIQVDTITSTGNVTINSNTEITGTLELTSQLTASDIEVSNITSVGNLSIVNSSGIDATAEVRIVGNTNITGGLFVTESGNNDLLKVGVDRLFVSASGRVGIGTTSPSEQLHVRSAIGASAGFMVEADNFAVFLLRADSDSNPRVWDISTNPGDGRLMFREDGASERLVITETGSIGIGTASPQDNFPMGFDSSSINRVLQIKSDDIDQDVGIFIRRGGGTNVGLDLWLDSGATDVFIENRFTGDIVFRRAGGTTPVEGLRLNSNGTASITGTLDVSDNLEVTNTGSFGRIEKTAGSFRIPHPDPSLHETHELFHSFVESPSGGENLYRWRIKSDIDGETVNIDLPDYWKFLNANPQVWVSPYKHVSPKCSGWVNDDLTVLHVICDAPGEYEILLIGTRKDEHAGWAGAVRERRK